MAEMSTIPHMVLHLGLVTMEIYAGYSVTKFLDGATVTARHDDCANLGQVTTAEELGYPDVPSMNRDHDVVHNLLPVWFGLRTSPTLYGIATHQPWPHAWAEEACVLAIQRLLRLLGIDPVALAERL